MWKFRLVEAVSLLVAMADLELTKWLMNQNGTYNLLNKMFNWAKSKWIFQFECIENDQIHENLCKHNILYW